MIITAKNGNFSYRMSSLALCGLTITPPIQFIDNQSVTKGFNYIQTVFEDIAPAVPRFVL